MGKAQGNKQFGDGTLVVDHPKPLFDHLLEINTPPANNTIHRRIRTCLNQFGQLVHLLLS